MLCLTFLKLISPQGATKRSTEILAAKDKKKRHKKHKSLKRFKTKRLSPSYRCSSDGTHDNVMIIILF